MTAQCRKSWAIISSAQLAAALPPLSRNAKLQESGGKVKAQCATSPDTTNWKSICETASVQRIPVNSFL